MKLINDSVFIEKRNSVIQHMREGNHMFYSSMQELLKYVSTQFLRVATIENRNFKNQRDAILNEGGNAISTIKLVCKIIKKPELFDTINMSLINILANTSKHSTLVFPYVKEFAENIVVSYNDYINKMWKSNKDTTGTFLQNCYIKFESPKNTQTKAKQPQKNPVIKLAEDFCKGNIAKLSFNRKYDNLSNHDKDIIKEHYIELYDKQYTDKDYHKIVVNIEGNDWFFAFSKDDKRFMYKSIYFALVKRTTDFTRASWYENAPFIYDISPASCPIRELLTMQNICIADKLMEKLDYIPNITLKESPDKENFIFIDREGSHLINEDYETLRKSGFKFDYYNYYTTFKFYSSTLSLNKISRRYIYFELGEKDSSAVFIADDE